MRTIYSGFCFLITVIFSGCATQDASLAARMYQHDADGNRYGDDAARKLSIMYRYGLGGLQKNAELADKYNAIAKTLGHGISDASPVKRVVTLANGGRYEGDFIDDKRTGKGVFTWPNGDRYEGDFIDDERTGKGVLAWANGNRYEGDFKNNEMGGDGVYTWANGDRYEGSIINGKIYEGKMRTSGGLEYEYKNGVKQQPSASASGSGASFINFIGAVLLPVAAQSMAQRNAQRGVSMPSPSISSSPSAPSSYTLSQNSSVQNNVNGKVGEDATYCIQHLGKGFKNNCGFDVNYFVCVTEQPPDTVARPCDDVRWPLNKMHDQPITAYTSNSDINAYNGKHVFWVACKAPARTQNKSFTNNKLTAMCVQR